MSTLRKESYRTKKGETVTGWRMRFYQDRRRRSLWIGPGSKKRADTVARHVDELLRANAANVAPDAETTKWAAGVEERLHRTLAGWGLVDARAAVDCDSRMCGAFFESWIAGQTHASPRTRNNYRQAANWFAKRFGRGRPLSSITPADFEAWHRWMIDPTRLAEATANKHAKRVRTMFKHAIKARLLHENPGTDTTIGGEVNRERDHYVDRAAVAAILAKCDTQWRLTLALCRFAGLRCPSEVTGLLWSDIHWEEKRIRIDSQKTGLRFCPIFPELLPFLDEAWDAAPEGASRLVTHRGRESNLRTQLKRIVESAGLCFWPKPFVNLRASCRTDLEERYPAHVCDAWLGHSTKVARKHYLQVTEAHWERATTESDPKHVELPATANSPGAHPGPISAVPEPTANLPGTSRAETTPQDTDLCGVDGSGTTGQHPRQDSNL